MGLTSMDWLLRPMAFLLAAVALHAIMRRVISGVGAVAAYLAVGGALGAIFAAISLRRYGPDARWAAGLLIYALGCELYIFLFTMVSSSISASILLTLSRKPLSESELAAALGGKDMVARRFDRLIQTALIRRQGEAYVITEKGLKLIRTFRALRSFFRHTAAR